MTLSDSRTCRTSSHAEPRICTPFQIIATSTTTTAEFSAAIERMRQRIGTARTKPTSRKWPRPAKLAGDSIISRWPECCTNSVDLANSLNQGCRSRIALHLGVNGAHGRLKRFPVEIAHDV